VSGQRTVDSDQREGLAGQMLIAAWAERWLLNAWSFGFLHEEVDA
jgi:hypothetical protein